MLLAGTVVLCAGSDLRPLLQAEEEVEPVRLVAQEKEVLRIVLLCAGSDVLRSGPRSDVLCTGSDLLQARADLLCTGSVLCSPDAGPRRENALRRNPAGSEERSGQSLTTPITAMSPMAG